MLTDQMIGRIAYIHTKCFTHNHAKIGGVALLFLIDFGLARRYRNRGSASTYHREKMVPSLALPDKPAVHMLVWSRLQRCCGIIRLPVDVF